MLFASSKVKVCLIGPEQQKSLHVGWLMAVAPIFSRFWGLNPDVAGLSSRYVSRLLLTSDMLRIVNQTDIISMFMLGITLSPNIKDILYSIYHGVAVTPPPSSP
jgi:hypothetical protein